MATESPDEVGIDLMNNSILIQAAEEDPVPFKKNTFRPFLLFGERIPNLHRPGLYLHLVIVSLQFLFYKNTQEIINFTLDNITLENNVTESLFKNDFSKPLLASVSYLLIPFIVYFCDRQKVRRYYLVFSSILMGFIAGCILLILLLLKYFERETLSSIISGDGNPFFVVDIKYFVDTVGYTFCVLSYFLFTFSFSLSYPFSIIFGLDILHGTQFETLILYFPLFYLARNTGGIVSYLIYVDIVTEYPYIHCVITTLAIFIALLLTVFGRRRGYFMDSAVVANNFSFYQGLRILVGAFSRKFIYRNKPNFESLMLFTARKKGYGNPRDLVDKTRAMIKINFILLILIPILACNQVLEQLDPQQANFLIFIPKLVLSNNDNHCINKTYFLSYFFFDPLTIVILGPFIEYFFYDIIFDNKRIDLPCWVNCISLRIRFIRANCGFRFRERLQKHFTLVDPLLKRIFWGLPFGLLSAICALTVEVMRIQNHTDANGTMSNCDKGTYSLSSHIPLISQIPQLILSGILEVISLIGLLQYTYFLCSKHFQNSLKGFFFSLFYFYYGVAGFLSNMFYFTFDEICANHCKNGTISIVNDTTSKWCLVDNTDCQTSFLLNAWAIWVLVIALYLIMIPLFYLMSHKNHWKKVRANKMFLQEMDTNAGLSSSLLN